MGKKKAGERFCIKFNERDPVLKKALEILESQGRYGKAQYIATLCYANCLEKPEAPQAQTAWIQDEGYLKRLNREVLGYEMEKIQKGERETGSGSELRRRLKPEKRDNDFCVEDGADKEISHGLKNMSSAEQMRMMFAGRRAFLPNSAEKTVCGVISARNANSSCVI